MRVRIGVAFIGVAGTDDVDTYFLRTDFLREHAGQMVDGGLASAVRRQPFEIVVPRAGGEKHNAAARKKKRNGSPNDIKRAMHVDLERTFPILRFHPHKRTSRSCGRIQNEKIEGAFELL